MPGIESLIGYGQAQVLPRGGSDQDFVQQLNWQKQQGIANKRYDERLRQQNEKELYGIIGDQLNPKNFNSLVQDKLRTAQAGLAAKIKSGGLGYGDIFMAANQAAGEIGGLSDKLNRIDSQLAATRGEYEKYDKRLNTPAIEYEARKKIMDALRTNQPIDENANHFDEALSSMGENALVDKSGSTSLSFLPEEEQNLKGKSRERNKAGKTNEFDWSVKTYPSVYAMKNNGEDAAPEISVRSEPSGIKDANGNDVPAMSEDAYRRFVALPSNRKALDARIMKQYGNVPLGSQQAETLRRVEAYKDAQKNIPVVNKTRIETQPLPHYTNNFYNNKNGELNYNDVWGNLYGKAKSASEAYSKGDKNTITNAVNFEDLDQDEQKLVKAQITQSNSDIEGDNIKVILTPEGKLGIFKKDDGTRVGYISKTANIDANQKLGQKVKINAFDDSQKQKPKGKHPLPKGQSRRREQNGVIYTWDEETGQYE